MKVSFEVIHVGGKGPRAMAVRPVTDTGPPPAPRKPGRGNTRHAGSAPASGAAIALPLILAYYGVMVWSVWRSGLPLWGLGASFALNLFTFFVYWRDKYSAGRGGWRVPENTLHVLSLAGGWTGAWIAQQVLRHKSAKLSFRVTYWVTVVLHCAASAWALRQLM